MASANRRQLIERGAFVALVGIAVLGVVGAALVALYINRIADSAAALKHSEPLPDYVGRPSSATAPDGTSAMNVLVAVTDNGGLQAVVVANLSASRRNLTLIAVPAALRLAAGEEHTLASSFAADPMLTARAVERLTGSRVDHLIQVDLAGFADVVDAVGGVQLDGQELDGAAAVAAVRDSDQPSTAAAALLRATLVSAEPSLGMPALAVPVDAIRAASHCTRIDAGLTSEVIAQTLMASSVRASEIRIWPLTTVVDGDAVVPEVGALGILTAALAEPNLTATAAYGAAAFLPR
ncbi:MAG: LCP family protein [Propionibacteriaceae bacterium]|nr:LCP family protein [Propionibacteriaceae bacterium]